MRCISTARRLHYERRVVSHREGGFTLLEVMLVVVIIAVLAAIAVPLFMSEEQTTKGESESLEMFTSLSLAEESYMLENGTYLSTGANETDTWPVAPASSPQPLTPYPATWTALKVTPPIPATRCTYVVIAGQPGDAAGPQAVGAFGFTPPTSTAWYYVLAHCDGDQDSSVDGYFFQSSVDKTFREVNPDR
jgi:prepilin-type N-terminal cleavage/methylation domain-containing protein